MNGSRRQFLSAALVGLAPKSESPIAGSFVNEDHHIGHELRHKACLRTPQRTERVPVVIVGGGIGGLSAAWRLEKRGFRDFVLLELAKRAGGNSRWGENEVSAYPWAAHYVPIPDAGSAPLVRELFEELGVLKDGRWEERHLCFSPQERLFLHGRWHEGLEPLADSSPADRRQFRLFDERIAELRASGQFTIPMQAGAKPSPLDRLTMAAWMKGEGFDSPYLRWYVDYACRDDYGSLASGTSAWAGVHYFASRHPEEKGPLTWPEGNGWIARRLLAKLGRFVRTGSMAYRIRRQGSRLLVCTEDVEYAADAVIFAAPAFVAPYIIEGFGPLRGFEYSPWLTANLTLNRLPRERGLEPAWDNVIYNSPSLGYVVATHQSLSSRVERTVWTYYWALAEGSPAENRRRLLENDWGHWKEAILNDLSRAHPDIRACVTRVDIMRLGHAMIRPAPGFLESSDRKRLAGGIGNLLFAHSDVSGFSIFEEAQYRGVTAADWVLRMVSR